MDIRTPKMPNEHVKEIIHRQTIGINLMKEKCIALAGDSLNQNIPIYHERFKTLMCPPNFDQIYCWPQTPADTVATVQCPSYIVGFLETHNATRRCMQDGTWFVNSQNSTWTNYTDCFVGTLTTIYKENHIKSNIPDESEAVFPAVKVIATTGYALSLGTLIIAFAIMFLIKKLHCARNILHMNLFASFILRSLFYILKDILFIDGMGLPTDFTLQNGSLYFMTDVKTNNYECKLVTSLFQYFTTANYSWILMEGLYLNNLIFRALFADSSKNLINYIILGWGLPILVIIPWVIARLMIEDTLCWTTNDNTLVFLIITIPTTVSMMINLVLFVLISIVLYTKLRSPINEDSKRYQKWAKSTLVLVPLFGVLYVVLLIFWIAGQNNVWLIGDMLFGSFQGFFVAVLYCFLNGEVKTELNPYICNMLSFCATNRYIRYCFPCRDRYLSSAVGRQSVCTTMSCSSLYNNAIVPRNSKTKWDVFAKAKGQNSSGVNDKGNKEHVCYNSRNSRCGQNVLNMAHCHNKLSKNGHFANPETSLIIEQNKHERYPPDPLIIEEEVNMLSRNC